MRKDIEVPARMRRRPCPLVQNRSRQQQERCSTSLDRPCQVPLSTRVPRTWHTLQRARRSTGPRLSQALRFLGCVGRRSRKELIFQQSLGCHFQRSEPLQEPPPLPLFRTGG